MGRPLAGELGQDEDPGNTNHNNRLPVVEVETVPESHDEDNSSNYADEPEHEQQQRHGDDARNGISAHDKQFHIPWGHPMLNDIGPEIMRTFGGNPNGFKAKNGFESLRQHMEDVHGARCGVIGHYETNVAGKGYAAANYTSILKRQFIHQRSSITNTDVKVTDKVYQPGGASMAVTGKWTTRFKEAGTDPKLGRWSWVTLRCKGGRALTLISAYRVCRDSASVAPRGASGNRGLKKASTQQRVLLQQTDTPHAKPRDKFIDDLIPFINKRKRNKEDILLMVDMNECYENGDQTGLHRLVQECELCDPHAAMHGYDAPPSYQRGSYRIDFMLCTPRVLQAVVRCGMLPLGQLGTSDHRFLYCDLDASVLFDGVTDDSGDHASRRLVSTNPAAVEVYSTYLQQYFAEHHVFERLADLEKSSSDDRFDAAAEVKYEALDRDITRGMLAAEKRCPARVNYKYAWSLALRQAGIQVRYWDLRRKFFSNKKIDPNEIARLEQVLADHDMGVDSGEVSLRQIRSNLADANKALSEVRKESSKQRKKSLGQRAAFYAAQHNVTAEAAVKQIQKSEKDAAEYRQLGQITKPERRGCVQFVNVPRSLLNAEQTAELNAQADNAEYLPVYNASEIHETILRRNVRHFGQSQVTPFGGGDRATGLGETSDSASASALLQGTYDYRLRELSQECQHWLQQLKEQPAVAAGAKVSVKIDDATFIDGWKKLRESTSSSPSGRHFGHYKTAVVVSRLPEAHPAYFPQLSHLHAAMCHFPVKHGFAPKRWCESTNVMLEKIEGNPRLDKLRVIHLLEADFNYVLRLVWGKRLVSFAEDRGYLGEEQGGNRSGRKANDQCLEKILVYDNARLTRTALITIDNDAKSCYDRILRSLAMIACMSFGLPLCAALMHNKVHGSMKHRVKTAHGLSTDSYCGTAGALLGGTGQGSCASPSIWMIYSVTLLVAFERFAHGGMKVYDPALLDGAANAAARVVLYAIYYVDDGMPGVNEDLLMAPLMGQSNLRSQASQLSQSWEKLLYGSGGALELPKCFSFQVFWKWNKGVPVLLSQDKNELEGNIKVVASQSGQQHILPNIDVTTGKRTLGLRISPAGSWKTEYNFRMTQSKELALQIAGATLARSTAIKGYRQIYCPRLEYPLALTGFTPKECAKIQSPAINVFLQKMGYARTLPRAVVFGPQPLGGVGFHDYETEQGLAHIKTFVGHVREPRSRPGTLLRSSLNWCQRHAGLSTPILDCTKEKLDYVETCWIMDLRKFLKQSKLAIVTTNAWTPAKLRRNDTCIMEVINKEFTQGQLRKINACRMYLRVTYLSEVVTADGTMQ